MSSRILMSVSYKPRAQDPPRHENPHLCEQKTRLDRSRNGARAVRRAPPPNRRSPNFRTPAVGSSSLLPWGAAAKIMRNTLANASGN